MKTLKCPICGSEPHYEKSPMWHGSHGYHDCYRHDFTCPTCKLLESGADDVSRVEEKTSYDQAIKNWNDKVKKVSKFLKNKEKDKVEEQKMIDRFQWIQTPDGTYILIDTWNDKVVEGAPTYTTSSTNSSDSLKK